MIFCGNISILEFPCCEEGMGFKKVVEFAKKCSFNFTNG
jgi:hypothetical protein